MNGNPSVPGEKAKEIGLDAFLVLSIESSDFAHLFYLTEFPGSFGLFLVDSNSIFMTDPRYSERVREELPPSAPEGDPGEVVRGPGGGNERAGPPDSGFNSRTTTVKLLELWREKIPGVEAVPGTAESRSCG